MTIPVRGARPEELPALRQLMLDAFQGDEHLLWDYLCENDPGMTPEAIRVALSPQGEPVACTVALPRRIMGPHGPVDGAILTLVACRPDLQGQGYGGATVRDALRHVASRGQAFAMLVGHPDYYPRFGFVPVLPESRTLLPATEKLAEEGAALRPAATADLPTLAGLYDRHLARYTCAVARGAAPWHWQVRNSKAYDLVMLTEGGPGYALVTENRQQDLLFVSEAAADEPLAARRLLAALAREARRRELKEVRLAMPPDHLVSRVAVLALGAEQLHRPTRYGMVAVTDWQRLLPPGFTVEPDGLRREGRLVLRAPEADLVRLAFGARSVDDLLLAGAARAPGPEDRPADEVRLLGEPPDLEAIRQAFPPRYTRWSLAPFWM